MLLHSGRSRLRMDSQRRRVNAAGAERVAGAGGRAWGGAGALGRRRRGVFRLERNDCIWVGDRLEMCGELNKALVAEIDP